MEVLGLEDIEQVNTAVEDLTSESVNLIFVGIDQSGSMYAYTSDMNKALVDFKDAIVNSKENEEILVARADFNDSINVGGYKKIAEFDTNYYAAGGTALYDVIVDGAKKLDDYIEHLKSQGIRVKAVFAIFSDGEDTTSRNNLHGGQTSIDGLNKKEIVTAFISFGGIASSEARRLGFKNILDVGSSASELRKAFNVLSKSVIENSKSVIGKQDDFFDI